MGSVVAGAKQIVRCYPLRLTVLLLLSSLVIVFGTLAWKSQNELENVITKQAQLQQSILKLKNKLSEQRRSETGPEFNFDQYSKLVPPYEEFALFLGEFYAWLSEAGLTVDSVTYEPEEDQQTALLKYGLSFSISATYEQLKHFIYLLEDSARLLIVNQISLTGAKKDGKDGTANLSIDLTTYFCKERP